jgi:hypothetical protein
MTFLGEKNTPDTIEARNLLDKLRLIINPLVRNYISQPSSAAHLSFSDIGKIIKK